MVDIAEYAPEASKKDITSKAKIRIRSREIFKTFQPLDTLIINPLINIIRPIFKILKFKSNTIGTIVLMSFSFSLYFLYKSKNNLVWLFLFFGIFIGFFDDLHYVVTSKKAYLIKKADKSTKADKTINKNLYNLLNYEHKEMYNILIKLTMFVLFRILSIVKCLNPKNFSLLL